MELRPGITTFKLNGEDFEFTGIGKDTQDPTKPKLAVRPHPELPVTDGALYRLLDPSVVKAEATDFWISAEELTAARLKDQYTSQAEIFEMDGITQPLSNGEQGIIGIDGKEYPIPSLETIQRRMLEQADLFGIKIKQGFTKLQLTPVALPISVLAESVGEAIKTHTKEGKIFHAKKNSSNPDVDIEVYELFGDYITKSYLPSEKFNKTLFYLPKSFTPDHKEFNKATIINTKEFCFVPGWSVGLVEDTPFTPQEGQGQTIGGRKQLENNHSPNEYLQALSSPSYKGETGWTIEDFLTNFLIHLEETNQVSHDYNDASSALLTGSYIDGAGAPNGDWRNKNLFVGAQSPRVKNPKASAVCMVRLGSKNT